MSTTPAPAVTHATQDVPVASIYPSRTNPRKHFDKAGLEELAASVRAHGVLQPVLVRPKAKPSSDGSGPQAAYELVAGERRFRAAKLAGLEAIPALVRELTDEQALEVQVIENLQRSDLHPLEEAEGYEQLLKLHHQTVEDLAAKVGKSKAYVYGRLRLTSLGADLRKAFFAGEITPSLALILARVPSKDQQLQIHRNMLAETWHPWTPEMVRKLIRERYSQLLKDAPFPLDDATLLPKAGPCTVCPKRTANQHELFDDVDKTDMCTDTTCFRAKREAVGQRQVEAAKAAGRPVLRGEAAKKVFGQHSMQPVGGGYVDLNDRVPEDSKGRTYRQLLKGSETVEAATVAVSPHDLEVHQLLTAKQASAALKESGFKPSSRSSSSRRAPTAPREDPKELLERTVRDAIWLAIQAKRKTKLDRSDLEDVAVWIIDSISMGEGLPDVFFKGFDFKRPTGYGEVVTKAYRAWLSTFDVQDFAGLLRGLLTLSGVDTYDDVAPLLAAAKRAGVDASAIRKQVTEAASAVLAAAEPKAAKTAKGKAAKKAKRRAA